MEKERLPLVSVIVLSFNYARYIGEAIESVFKQNFDPGQIEIIVVDDGSADETPLVCSHYSLRIKYVYTKNRGVSHVLNVGYTLSRGEFYAILSADDYWLPQKLKKSIQLLQEDPGISMAGHKNIRKSAETEYKDKNDMKYLSKIDRIDTVLKSREFGRGDFLQGSTLVFRKGIMNKFMPIPVGVQLFNDQYMSQLAKYCGKVGLINEYLGIYRQHDSNYYARAVEKERLVKITCQYSVFKDKVEEWVTKRGFLNTNKVARDSIAFSKIEMSYLNSVLNRNTLYAFLRSLQMTRYYCPGAPLRKQLYLYLGCLLIPYLGVADYTRWMQGIKVGRANHVEFLRKVIRFCRLKW